MKYIAFTIGLVCVYFFILVIMELIAEWLTKDR